MNLREGGVRGLVRNFLQVFGYGCPDVEENVRLAGPRDSPVWCKEKCWKDTPRAAGISRNSENVAALSFPLSRRNNAGPCTSAQMNTGRSCPGGPRAAPVARITLG